MLINACDFYISELSALKEIKTQCEEMEKKIDKADVLKIDAINNLKITIANAIKRITQTGDN